MNTSTNTMTIESGASRKSKLAFQRLCWKEARQIAPLAIVLLAINLVLHLLLADKRSGHQFHLLLLQLIPCLFAIGAGALLVSQEKEQRTIGWLSSLPIASSQILRVKMFVSLLGLAIVWLACLLLALIFDRESLLGAPSGVPFPPVLLMVINSVFLLFLGIATAWRLQSPLVALVMIVPLATLPTIFGIVAQGFSPENRISDFAIGGLYLLLSGAFLWYGWRSGQAFLTSKPQSVLWQRLLNTFERRGSRGNLLGAQPQGIASTLLWQFSVQNRMLPIAFVAIIVLPLAMYMFQKTPMTDNSIISVVAWLIASWLGASVFQSDSVHQRIKFLAERGVAPRTIWWTRQIIPFGLVLIATAIALLLARKVMVNLYSQQISNPLMLLGLPMVLVAHAAAQWLGQIIRSPIVSLIVAPAITLGAIGYIGFAVLTMGAPYWMVIAPIVIAFSATRVMTQAWIDGRTGRKYWLGHAAFLLAAVGIPAIPLLVTAATYPGMPRSVWQSFYADSNKYGFSSDPFDLVLTAKQVVSTDMELSEAGGMGTMNSSGSGLEGLSPAGVESIAVEPGIGTDKQGVDGELEGADIIGMSGEAAKEQPALGFVEQIKRNVSSIEEQLAERSGSVRWSQAVSFLAAEAMLTRAQLDIDPSNKASIDRYRTAMRILNAVVNRMRLSWRLVDQEFADRLERWMLEQLKAKDARETLGESNWDAITRTLADKAGRMAARRRAIVQSWARALASGQLELGGMPIANTTGLSGWRGQIVDFRRISRVSWLLLQYLESKDQSEADKRFADIASAWEVHANRNQQIGLSLETGLQIPGQIWLGDWENYR